MPEPIDKHLRARIAMCLRLAELSNCPRRKFGAMLYDPVRKQSRGESYNGGPRGGGRLCGGEVCLRDQPARSWTFYDFNEQGATAPGGCNLHHGPGPSWWFTDEKGQDIHLDVEKLAGVQEVAAYVDKRIPAPPIVSGTRTEIGCHHAEANVIANAAECGTATGGLWLIVTGEPCLGCSRLIHHAGIARVVCVDGGYAGGSAGVEYLRAHGVQVQLVEGPQDPRAGGAS